MKPYREQKNYEATYDPDTGKDRIWLHKEKQTYRSSSGSINTDGVTRIVFKDCGCDGEIGGRCYECGDVSCKECHGRCEKCKKPICLQHSKFMKTDTGEMIRLCGEHYDELSRKRNRKKILSFLLFPFVERAEGREESNV